MRLLTLFMIGAAGLAQAQAPPQPSKPAADDNESRIQVQVNRVNILFTVTDKKGRFVTDLNKSDFQVIENKQPQTIMEFATESDLPLRLAVLIDTSNSIRDRFRFIQTAAIDFLTTVMRPNEDRAMVVSFDSSAKLVSDLDGDPDKLAGLVRDLRPGGGTALFDAVYFACRNRLGADQPRYKFRRAMVILSDGDDNQSEMSRDQALEMAQKADTVIYTISTNISHIETDGDKILKYLANETGGQAFFPFKPEDLSQSFENIANELRHQYNIFYRPEPMKTDGSYQAISLRVKDRKDLIVRARKGYYAPKL